MRAVNQEWPSGITIDGTETRDRDDAIWVDKKSDGWDVTVCIANVAASIAKCSPEDVTAHRRVETNYLPNGRNEPMIPRRFSEGECSLTLAQSRKVMVIRIHVDLNLRPRLVSITPMDLVTSAVLSYGDVPKIYKDEGHLLHGLIRTMAEFASVLMQHRRDSGAFVLYDMNQGWLTTEEGYIRRFKDTEDTLGQIIVQEFMILANSEVAKFCAEQEIPVPFRNHTARASAPDRQSMMDRLSLGILTGGGNQDFELARRQFGLVMNKARYSPLLEGHYGLNLPSYVHATSPIRRYADLIVQRQVLARVAGEELPYTQEEVEEISEHINGVRLEKSQRVEKIQIELANRKAELALRGDDIERLSDADFERVVKLSIRSGEFNPTVADSFLKRLHSDTAALIDIHFILFRSSESWAPIRRSIVEYLSKNPHHAPSVVAISSQLEGWSTPTFQIEMLGDGQGVRHSAQVSFEKPGIVSLPQEADSLKLAKQRAIVCAIAAAVEEEAPAWDLPADREATSDRLMLKANSDNPVSELVEYCQRAGIKLPVYELRRTGGTDHAPNFESACSVQEIIVISDPQPNKRIAKKKAASRMIRAILEKEQGS